MGLLSPKCVTHLDTSTKLFEGVDMDHINHFSKVNPKFSPGNTLPGANFQISPIENGSRLLDIIETSFWCVSTRLDVLSKSQIRFEDVRSPLHPLKGHLVHFRRFFKTFLLGVQVSNLAESGVFLLILSDSSRNLARGMDILNRKDWTKAFSGALT